MTVREAASRLEVGVSTVYALIAAGKLPHCRFGTGRGCIRITEEQLARFLASAERGTEAAPAPIRVPTPKHVRLPS